MVWNWRLKAIVTYQHLVTLFILQVLVPAAGIRGFLDASEFGTWLKHFQRSEQKQNIKHFLVGGQIYYETLRQIQMGEELLLGTKRDFLKIW